MTKPVKPTAWKLPRGFVDAFGLDDDDIPFRPFYVSPTKSSAAKAQASAAPRKPRSPRAKPA